MSIPDDFTIETSRLVLRPFREPDGMPRPLEYFNAEALFEVTRQEWVDRHGA